MIRRPPRSTLFPSTPLFRSARRRPPGGPPRSRRRAESPRRARVAPGDRKSTRLNSSHDQISYAVFCLKKKKTQRQQQRRQEKTSRQCVKQKRSPPTQSVDIL